MFKVNNKDTRTTIVNLEDVIAGWVGTCGGTRHNVNF